MEIIKLNLIPNGVNPTCHAKQYDEGRVIRFELFDGLTPYTLQSGDTVTLNLRKPDNTIIESSVTATQGNKYVDLVTTEQICAVAGYNLGTFKITNGSVEIGTLNFIMAVARDVLADGIPSQSVIEDLDALVEEAVGDNYYTKTQADALLAVKADNSDVIAINNRVNNLENTENRISKNDEILNSEFLTGYYYYGNVGSQVSKSANANSKYTEIIDVSEYIGGVLTIVLSNINPSSSRKWGFCNSNNVITQSYYEGDLFVYDENTNKYIATVPIKDEKFFFSCLNSLTADISYYYNFFVDEKQYNDISVWANMKTETPQTIKVSLVNSGTRTFSNENVWNNQIKSVSVSGVPNDYNFSIMRRVVSGSDTGGVETGWQSGSYTQARVFNEKYNYFLLKFKKTDGSNFTAQDIETLNENIVVTLNYNNLVENINDIQTCFVSTLGNNTNIGTRRDAPFATIQHALNKGYKKIFVKSGEYTDAVSLSNLKGVSIMLDRYNDSSSDIEP